GRSRWVAGADWSFDHREWLATHKRNGRRLLCGLPFRICLSVLKCFAPAAVAAFSTEAGTISAPGNYGAATSQDHKVMNTETTASHVTAVMKIAITQPGPRRRYVMQTAYQKEAKGDSDLPFVNRA